ncbi:hypothetical protein DXG03_001506 [Asterophora parasitica]|uniref:Uncharacterized protein n=1 Tax=Asterophora parasitica TaxID=117018 RepID=A0A9P7G5B4_9AGAR|nr:hypothetical protein DXG03_001506 [Asterophora parasitica]
MEAFVRQPTFSQFYIHARWRLTLVLALLAGEDIMVTCILVYLLFNSRTRTASSVNDVVSILIQDVFKTGIIDCLNARQRLRHRRNPVTSDRTRPSNPLDDMNVKGSRGSGEGSGSVPSSEPSVANPEEPKSTFRNRANSINEHGISFADAENLPSSYDTTVHSIGSHHDPGVIPVRRLQSDPSHPGALTPHM